MPVRNYSSGMFVRLGFAVAVHCEPEILLVDEVLAVGDAGFQLKCFNKIAEIKKRGVTTVLVTHNMNWVSTFCDSAVLLSDGKASYFSEVNEAVSAYQHIFNVSEYEELEKVNSGNDLIQFYDYKVDKQEYAAGDDIEVSLYYEAKERT